jgi:hypothetical protein
MTESASGEINADSGRGVIIDGDDSSNGDADALVLIHDGDLSGGGGGGG